MANTNSLIKLVDGKDVFEYHINLAGEGAGTDFTAEVIVDSSALEGGGPIKEIQTIEWSLSGFDVRLFFDATTDQPIYYLPAGTDRLDLTGKHPIVNQEGTGSTGDIVATTVGMTTATDIGFIILKGRKRRVV